MEKARKISLLSLWEPVYTFKLYRPAQDAGYVLILESAYYSLIFKFFRDLFIFFHQEYCIQCKRPG